MPLDLLQKQLGHTTIQMTMRYATCHPDYNDVGKYFDRVGERFGLVAGNILGNTPTEKAPEGALQEQP